MRVAFTWPRRLLRRRPKYAQGGHIPPLPAASDDVQVFLSEGRVWRVIDGKLVETDDIFLRKFNKLRER